MGQLPLDTPRRHEILRALERMADHVGITDVPARAAEGRAMLADVLAAPAAPSAHRISAIGHAHIDSAWLWPVRETVRKCARTFTNVLALMDDYPEMRFACSQAQQYEWMRTRYPSIFERITERIADGRWIPVGGMWVESDTNLPSGESLIRQFTHGQRFFEEHFGVTCTEVWLPDVFGYSASLPQIMSACGIERFLTQKLSWNTTNRFPHHSFVWEGIDGSTVFAHFPPVETYNATFRPSELAHAVRTFADKGRATRSLMPFGHGDGGGGPTPEMLERFRRVRNLEGAPRIEIESPAKFFDEAIAEYPDAPRWVGELYFEMHRGTYTSQAATKAGNRRCEQLLREAELWSVRSGTDSVEVAAALDRLWKDVLLLQFHDILPGSSIAWVHHDAEAEHRRIIAELEALIDRLLRAAPSPSTPSVINTAPHDRREVAVLDEEVFDSADLDGLGAVSQRLADDRVAIALDVAAHSVTALGDAVARGLAGAASGAPVGVCADGADLVISNGLVSIRVAPDGTVSSMFDHRLDRELVARGRAANVVQLHSDLPNVFDAWDIEEFSRRDVIDVVADAPHVVLDGGPLVARVLVHRRIGATVIDQTLVLRAGSARVDVEHRVDWHHQEHLLRLEHAVAVHTVDMVREIQFGHVRTPIHTNTGWDVARFEVCAHRWVSVAEHGLGFAALDDAKYGHHGVRLPADRPHGRPAATAVRTTLLRGPRYPDPAADQGVHTFTCSMIAHDGDLTAVVQEGYRLNLPLRVADAASPDALPVVGSSNPAVVVETVKWADDRTGDVVVRLYESQGGRAGTTLSVGDGVVGVTRVDARERSVDSAQALDGGTGGDTLRIELGPFELVTLRLARS
ncbi:MAG: glycoside hydrolase family 38 C-terminal domain-containing protein [Microthrixaceae bacterium]